jgi:hypothetical protein
MQPYLPPHLWARLINASVDSFPPETRAETVELLRQRRAGTARDSWPVFTEFVLKDDYGDATELAPIHLSWIEHIQYCWRNGLNPGILSPRGHGKTQQLVALVLYEIGRDPNVRIKIVCNSEDEAAKRVQLIGRYVEQSEDLRLVFPHLSPAERGRWNTSQLYVQRTGYSVDPTVEAKAVLSTGVGGRSGLLIFDDPVDFRNAISNPALRPKVLEAIQNVWMNTLLPGGRIVCIGTAWHQQDAIHEFMKNPAFCFLIQKVSQDFTCIESSIV